MTPFKIAAVVTLVSLMLGTGLQCDRKLLGVALKNHWLFARAFLANFVVVPLIAVAVVRVFQLDGPVPVGILLMAIAPGAPFLARSAGLKIGGNLGFAIALAIVMPALAIVTIPISAGLVLPPGAEAQLPWLSLTLKLIAFQFIPLLIGILIADRAPEFADKLEKPLGLIMLAGVLAVFYLIVPPFVKAFLSVSGSNGILAMAVVVALSLIAGWLFGGARREFRRTLSIGTAVKNVGLGLLVATTSFDDKLVAATVMAYFLVQLVIVTVVRLFLIRTVQTS